MDTHADHPPGTTPSYPADGGVHQQDHFNGGCYGQQQSDHYHSYNYDSSSNSHFNDSADYGGYVKLYVVGITRTATEQDVAAVFGEFGHIVDIFIHKDKWTGVQKECCFVKYATLEQADRAIGALNGHYTFPGAAIHMEVRYADGERERLGSFYFHKLYVGCLNRQASNREVEEIFSPFGVIDDIYLVRDEFKQNRGCAFVHFTRREMAVAAIQAVHGTYVMRGCDQPLIVRFADPKKPKIGDFRPAPRMNAPFNGQVPFNEMQHMKPSLSGTKTSVMTCNDNAAPTSHTVSSIDETDDFIECDWSEHVSPDGELYYYHCMTCESRWEKPEEYALYEQELDDQEGEQQWEDETKVHTLYSTQISEPQAVCS